MTYEIVFLRLKSVIIRLSEKANLLFGKKIL